MAEISISPPSVSTEDVHGPGREPPPRLGRFVLLEPLGSGGMGVVYSAWDRQLERRVALKVLHRDDRARSLREAQALARLQHPNVVTVHDVGSADGFDFIAMELVEGASLRAWLRQPRAWREVVAVFRHAGRGLAAAHAAGLVHRDFKPENVLIAANGAVRVADFGLAREHSDSEPRLRTTATLLTGVLTHTGALAGTRRYMAPEQHAGDPPDPRMDQYAFSVSLWEALFGCHPEENEPILVEGVPLRAATGRIPAWLRAAVKRGLASDASARFPSMDALLAALGREASRTRSVAIGAVVVTALVVLLVRHQAASPPQPCQDAARRLDGVWDPAVKRTVRAAFLATERSYAADTFDRAAGVLDQRAAAWAAMRTEACEASAVRHEQSDTLLDLRMQCLDRRLAELKALAGLFAHADAALIDYAVAAAHELATLEPCADARALLAAVPAPADADARARVEALRDELARAKALGNAGRYREARALAAGLVANARALGYAPALGEALLALAEAQMSLYEDASAQVTLEEAMRTLAEAKDDARIATSWIDLLNVVAVGLSRPAEALALRPGAETALVRAGNDPRQRARLLGNLGRALKQQGKLDEALLLQRQALAIQLLVLDASDPVLANTHNSIGVLLKGLGRFDEARAELERALALLGRVLGPDHPDVAGVLLNLAQVERLQGREATAAGLLERALAIQERALGADHPAVAMTLGSLGTSRMLRGDLDGARQCYDRALAIDEAKLPADHLSVALALVNSGAILVKFGEAAEARARIERALAIYRDKVDANDQRIARALGALGTALAALGRTDEASAAFTRALAAGEHDEGGINDAAAANAGALAELRLDQGRPAEALALADRALTIRERLRDPDDPEVASALTAKGGVLLALHRRAEARPLLERAVAVLERRGINPIELAEARFALARALAGTDARRARELATAARTLLAAVGRPGAADLVRVDAWLKTAP